MKKLLPEKAESCSVSFNRHGPAANPARGGRGEQGVRCSPSREGAGQPGSPTKDGGEEQLEGNGASVATPRKAGRDSCISLRNSPSRGNTQASKKVEALRGGEIDSFISGEDNRGSLGPILTVRDDMNDTDPQVTACEVKELLQI